MLVRYGDTLNRKSIGGYRAATNAIETRESLIEWAGAKRRRYPAGLLRLDQYPVGPSLRVFEPALSLEEAANGEWIDAYARTSRPEARHGRTWQRHRAVGCSVWKWIECGAAFAACAGLSGPAFIACVAAVAGDCVECVT